MRATLSRWRWTTWRPAAGLSKAHFSREFKQAFGDSPHAYLLTRRLERAAALLRTTDRSVADICFSVGLQSVGLFTTSFSRIFGRSPTAYRAAHPPARAFALVPGCVVRAYARPEHRTFREDSPRPAPASPSTLPFGPRRTTMTGSPTRSCGCTTRTRPSPSTPRRSAWRSRRRHARRDGRLPLAHGRPAGQDDVSIVLMAIPGPP